MLFHVTNFVPESSMTTLMGFSRSLDLNEDKAVVLSRQWILQTIEQRIKNDKCPFINSSVFNIFIFLSI